MHLDSYVYEFDIYSANYKKNLLQFKAKEFSFNILYVTIFISLSILRHWIDRITLYVSDNPLKELTSYKKW